MFNFALVHRFDQAKHLNNHNCNYNRQNFTEIHDWTAAFDKLKNSAYNYPNISQLKL